MTHISNLQQNMKGAWLGSHDPFKFFSASIIYGSAKASRQILHTGRLSSPSLRMTNHP